MLWRSRRRGSRAGAGAGFRPRSGARAGRWGGGWAWARVPALVRVPVLPDGGGRDRPGGDPDFSEPQAPTPVADLAWWGDAPGWGGFAGGGGAALHTPGRLDHRGRGRRRAAVQG